MRVGNKNLQMKRARSDILVVSKEGTRIPFPCDESQTICDLLKDSPDTTEIPLPEISAIVIDFIASQKYVPPVYFVPVAIALNYLNMPGRLEIVLNHIYATFFHNISKRQNYLPFVDLSRDLLVNYIFPETISVDLFAVCETYPTIWGITEAELTKRACNENLSLEAYYDLTVTFEGKVGFDSAKECMEDYHLTKHDMLRLKKPIQRKDALIASIEKHGSMDLILHHRKLAYDRIIESSLEKRAFDKLFAKFGKAEFKKIIANWE